MLPKHYRNRYALIIVLSLLIHTVLITVLLWGIPDQEKKNKKKSVVVKLKHIDQADKKKLEDKQAEPKKAGPKKAEPKKAEPKKAEPKKAEPKKAEPKKAEPKKAEPKKAEPKKAEPKKAEPKKAEPKKAEPKKAEPKKAEPKKAEPKKAEPKKAEPKKAEPKKAEPKKAEPKKAEPKKAEPKKAEPKKAEPKKAEPKKAEPKKAEPKKAEPKKAEPKKAEPKKRFSSMRMLDDRELKDAVVLSTGYGTRFREREQQGNRLIQSLNPYEQKELNQHLAKQVGHLFKTFKAPKKDGKKYYGEVSILLDENGYIEFLTFKKRSGHDELDQAVYDSIIAAKKLTLPRNFALRKAMTTRPLTSNYSEGDMAD